MKRWIALLLAAVLLLSCCAGCTAKKKTEDPTKPSTPSTPSQPAKPTMPPPTQGKVTLRIQMPQSPFITDYNNNALTKWLEKECNVDLEINPGSGKNDIRWATANEGTAQNAYDLSVFFADRNGASKVFWDRLEENFSEAEIQTVVARMTDPVSGAIYDVPTIEASPVNALDYQMWINREWLDELKLDAPHDIDSLYYVLKTFKANYPNCVPLYGSEKAGIGADVVNWLINLYIYYDNTKHFNVDDNGQLYAPFTTDQYREALKFINKLIDEGLLWSGCFSANSMNFVGTTTPYNGVAVCGIFAGHLGMHTAPESEVLYQYEALPMLGNVVFTDHSQWKGTYIEKDCQYPDRAFEVLMKLWSEEGSYRLRYGEPGVNWTEPDEGAKSLLGLDCTIKILNDPLMATRTCNWGVVYCTLLANSEGETTQHNGYASQWETYKGNLHGQSVIYHQQAAAANNPKKLLPWLVLTDEEKAQYEARYKNTVVKYYNDARIAFCRGDTGFDPYDNDDWNNYLAKLDELKLSDWMRLCQTIYDRQMKG